MVPLTDPELRKRIRIALSNWNITGYINWQPVAKQWVEENLEGYTARAIGELLYLHVCAGSDIDQVKETRPEWLEWEHHYDFRVRIGGRLVYLETRLDDDDPEDPVIFVVSAHDA